MLASVTLCNDDIRNYNSKISDLGPLTKDSIDASNCCGDFRTNGASAAYGSPMKRYLQSPHPLMHRMIDFIHRLSRL